MSVLTKSEVAEWIRDLVPYLKRPACLVPKGCFKEPRQDIEPGSIIEYDSTLMPVTPKLLEQTENLRCLVELYGSLKE